MAASPEGGKGEFLYSLPVGLRGGADSGYLPRVADDPVGHVGLKPLTDPPHIPFKGAALCKQLKNEHQTNTLPTHSIVTLPVNDMRNNDSKTSAT